MTKSEQARADALADAETLREAGYYPADYAIAVIDSSWFAHSDSWAFACGATAAHFAFRAVPGLRG